MPSDRHFDDLEWKAAELDGTDWMLGREKLPVATGNGRMPPEKGPC